MGRSEAEVAAIRSSSLLELAHFSLHQARIVKFKVSEFARRSLAGERLEPPDDGQGLYRRACEALELR
jgi:hypothetical protein